MSIAKKKPAAARKGAWARFIRPTFFWAHLVLGLLAGLIILVLAATGATLAFEPQVTAWANRDVLTLKTAPAPDAQRLGLEALAAAAVTSTGAEAVTGFSLQRDPLTTARLQLGRDKSVYVDPYTGAIVGEGKPGVAAFFQKTTDLHRWFLIEDKSRDTARLIKNLSNAAFFLIIFTAIFLWWPKHWNKHALKAILWPRLNAKGKARDFNWHNAFGILSWPFILLISFTGIIMANPWASDLVYRAAGTPVPPRPQAQGQAPSMNGGRGGKPEGAEGRPRGEGQAMGNGEGRRNREGGDQAKRPAKPLPFDEYLKAAEAQTPDWISISTRGGRGGQDTVMVMIQTQDLPMPQGRGTLTLKAKTGEVDGWEPYDAQATGKRWRNWVRWAHTGQAFGWLGQTFAALACLAILLQIYTGFALSWRRFFGAKRAS